jgi:propanol-preferring alcohol dehydrogenase
MKTEPELTMCAAVFDGKANSPLKMACLPVPEPGYGQLLVKLEACGVCHTDLHIWKGSVRPASGNPARILGHEGIGRIAALGDGINSFSLGDRIGVPWMHNTCGRCDECLAGQEAFCQSQQAHGFDVDGGFAEYVIVDARYAVSISDELDAVSTAPLMCAGVTAFSAIRRADLKAGMQCAIFGCGGLGLYAIQIAARSGVRVIALDISEEKLALARRMGAHATLLTNEDATERLKALGGMHACINFAPTTATWPLMIACIKPRGRIVATAMVSQPVPINQEWLTGTGVIITGTSVGTRLEMLELLRMHAEEPLLVETSRISLGEVENALLDLTNGKTRGRSVISYEYPHQN